MVGQVGNDAHGIWLKENLAGVGVDVGHVRAHPDACSGVAAITIDAQGQNQIIIVAGANGCLGLNEIEQSGPLIAAAGQVLLQLEIPLPAAQAAAQLARQAGALVLLDPAPGRPLPDDLLSLVDYLTPNETELMTLTGTPPGSLSVADAAGLARKLLARGVGKVIVKLGARGALLVGAVGEHFWPAIPVQAVDSTAAGDAFNAGFAAALARGASEQEAGCYATATAAYSVQHAGAQPSMPTPADVVLLLKDSR